MCVNRCNIDVSLNESPMNRLRTIMRAYGCRRETSTPAQDVALCRILSGDFDYFESGYLKVAPVYSSQDAIRNKRKCHRVGV